MIQRMTDLIPQPMIDELLRLAKVNREWLTIASYPDKFFRAKLLVPTFLKNYWRDGSEYLAGYAMSRFIADGPKIFRPTVEQCNALQNIEVRLPLEDYAQPFPALIIEPPAGMFEPFKALLMFRWKETLTLSLFSHDNRDDTLTTMKEGADCDMEQELTTFRADALDVADSASRLYRVGVNACLALVNFGCQKEALFKKQVEADRRLAGEQSERGARARARVKQSISIVSFAQEIKLHNTEGSHAHGEATGGEVSTHWRRGHWRTQHHGPKNSLTKRILIKPVLVRADKFVGELSDTSATYKGG